MQAYILRAANRVGYEAFEPQSITASGPEPDLSCAPVEAWELVESLDEALANSPAFGLKAVPQEPPAPPAPPNPAVLVKQRILEAMEFGKQLMAEFGAQNVLAGRSTAEIAAISDKLSIVQARLLSGSLYAALQAIDELVPDALVTEAVIQEFRGRIVAHLGQG